MTERKGEALTKQKLKKWRQNMKRIMTMAAIGIIAIGFGTATLNAAETGTGTKIIKNGLKEGLKNGMKNGMKNGKKNGDKK